MHEQLLGYLIGALDEDEHQQVEEQLRSSHDMRRVLDQLKAGLEPLSWDREHLPTPANLAARTCAFVENRRIAIPFREFGSRPTRWTMQDFLVAACILVAASMLFIPAVGHSRGLARIAQCQNNLRQLGIALDHYTQANNGYLPYIAPTGNLASSAAFAPRLVSAGVLADHRILSCPDVSSARGEVKLIPAADEIEQARPTELADFDRMMGGDYRVTLGYMEDGVYRPTRHLNRPYFAYAADAPNHALGKSFNHGGRGHNVLFEDWHVEFLKDSRCQHNDDSDDIFCNASGEVAPGLSRDDSVIAEGRFKLPPQVNFPSDSRR